MKILFAIFGLVLLMTSCEYSYDYSYTVTNRSGTQIKITVKTFRIDSTFVVMNDSVKTLFVTNHGIEGQKGPYFANVTEDLDNFTVRRNDTIISKRDYLKNESWIFNKGNYSTTVTAVEF